MSNGFPLSAQAHDYLKGPNPNKNKYITEDKAKEDECSRAWPIGSARGLVNKDALRTLRAYFPDIPLVIDAGLGTPSHAVEAMEMGYDAVLLVDVYDVGHGEAETCHVRLHCPPCYGQQAERLLRVDVKPFTALG